MDLLENDATYGQVLAVEDELSHEYVRGKLNPRQRAHFERTIGATARGKENIAFAQALSQILGEGRRRQPRRALIWMAAAAVFLMLLPGWLAWRVHELVRELQQARSDAVGTESRLRQELAAAKAPVASPPLEVAFLLTPAARGAGQAAELQVSPQAGRVRFQVVAPPDMGGAQLAVELRDAGGRQLWSESATLSGRIVSVSVPAAILSDGGYEIALRRVSAGEQETLETYSFRVVRK